jgi:2,3-bisphosphoglycerate-dependent phosphoglycerate mutase
MVYSKEWGGNVRPPHHFEGALNERDYGIYTGKNKWDIKAEVGQIKFDQIRRGWDVAIPEGESLRQVYARSVPFYLHTIVPLLASGQNVMMVAHGNSIRSLMKYIESISDSQIGQVDMIFGTIIMYSVDGTGRMLSKTTRSIEAITPFG